jgi:hypothetical protein
MIDLVDAQPAVEVPQAEYNRLLGYPRGWTLEGRAAELAEWARQWYAEHGRPWIYARLAESIQLPEGRVVIDGEAFASATLENMLRQAGADGAALVAVSAGPELEAEAARAWGDGRPDEYFFLEVFGSAVVERLTTLAGAQLCAWADGQSLAVLPHHSPGYPAWDVAEQPRLAALLKDTRRRPLPAALDVLDSGMLRPKKSQLAVFGLTRHLDRVERIADLVPCHRCCLVGCDYRRAAYRGPAPFSGSETLVALGAAKIGRTAATAPLDLAASYRVNAKALVRWTRERLVLHDRDGGAIDARFRYDGTTCTNLGRPLAFDYTVRLGRRDDGYPVEDACCMPADDDDGARSMCRYLDEGDSLLDRIAAERPLAGARLDEVLAWRRPDCAAGCFCDDEGREHKWGLVLETIHYALAQRERCSPVPRPKDTTV